MLLDLGAEKPPTLETFVVGANAELLQQLQRLATTANASLNESFVYIWGEPGAGKSHLLQAFGMVPSARYISVASTLDSANSAKIDADTNIDALTFDPTIRFYLLDDCDQLSEAAQIAAFALFNQVRENQGVMITAGKVAPAILNLREDLRTRLGWGLIYQVHELTDEEKISALQHSALARGLTLPPGVLPYLLTHFQRDMRSLSAMLDALDHYSLETKRPITLPLLRNLLQQEKEQPTQ